ncbi:MAG TPA: hypothetical protein VLX31_18670 [Streptosporangiaceae bacterium]|nr:hypothetical protein [Streptosporangiaceae bacterium]
MNDKFDREELRKLTPAERRTLLRDLVALERRTGPAVGSSWKWDAVLVVIVVSCIILAAWTGYLAVTLPRFYRTGSWRGAWVGFDIALLISFAAAGWAAWRRRQLLIISLVVLATLLICDAWFDVVLDVRTRGFWESVTSALVIELPLAIIAILMARRLLRLTFGQIMRYEGLTGRAPPLWKIPLLGPTSGTPIERLMKARALHKADISGACADGNGAERASRPAAELRMQGDWPAAADDPPDGDGEAPGGP